MKKQIISRITVLAIIFLCSGIVVGLLFKRGIEKPIYRYPHFSKSSQSWVEKMDHYNQDKSISYGNVGPFDWNNKKDIGQTDKNASWSHENNAFAITYYHADKTAENKLNALYVLELIDLLVPEIEEILGTFPSVESMNGRKIPIYLPGDDEEYKSLLQQMTNNNAALVSNDDGCSVVEYGPLGCLVRGIIVHPNGFKQYNGKQRYIQFIRREVMYYAYINMVNCNVDEVKPYLWFTNGLAEYFASGAGENGLTSLPSDYVDIIRQQCKLNGEFPQKNKVYVWAGCSFFQYMDIAYGKEFLSRLIQDTDSSSVDSVFYKYNIDMDQVHYQWVDTLMKMNNIYEY